MATRSKESIQSLINLEAKILKEDLDFYNEKLEELKGLSNTSAIWKSGYTEGVIFKTNQFLGFLEMLSKGV